MGQGHARGHRWEKFAAFVVQSYHGICHICGHPGARQVDHLTPVTEGGDEWDIRNCRPAHGAPGNPCPVCSLQAGSKIVCNQLRGMGSVARARRIIAERIAANQKQPPKERRQTYPGSGREW